MPHPRRGEDRKSFLSRCMGSAEAQRTAPEADQRYAMCNAFWERSRTIRKGFDVAKAACCQLYKQDVPEVEAVIRLLDPVVVDELRRFSEETTDELLRRLDLLSDDLGAPDVDVLAQAGERRSRVEDDILAALVLLVSRRAAVWASADSRDLIERAADSLLDDGALSVSLRLTGARRQALRATAAAELEALVQEAAAGRDAELTAKLAEFLRSRAAREPLSPLQEAALGPREPGSPARSRQEFEQDLGARLEAPGAPQALDQWAYRWFNVGALEAGQEAGFRAFRAFAVLDGQTTKFCRWINGRIIPLSRAQEQLRRQSEAAARGDFGALKANWPFLDATTLHNGNELQFERFMRRAALPPYHHGCRTVVRLVQL